MINILAEVAKVLTVEPIFNSSSDLIIVRKSLLLESFFEWTKDVVFTWRENRAVRGMSENLLAELQYQCSAHNCHMRTTIIRQDDNPARPHVSSMIHGNLSQFM
ncbi:hypothetical protein TNCV_5082291 [Trichonephila clavipes]|nr:hypothetical protein TNCV_5082291 [Trichonephila clavipes]